MNLLKSIFTGSGCDSAQHPSTPPHGAYVGESSALPEGGRLHAKVNGRYITLLRLDDQLYCIDSICFHAGGPLGVGDIEEVDGHKCLSCPWHSYKIDIATGDKYYQGVTFVDGKMVGGEWKSNGVRQRVHKVTEAEGKLYVELNKDSPQRCDSDGYAFDAQCGDRVLHSPPAALRARVHAVGADGRKPSGHVMRGQYKPQ